ncbi:MAG: M20/M25/M40 family metallo-hydrolase [Coriobacteriia bacterium]|nr:M20/M25/M40 family metallo-hydrolase [Coriobacteriia bacterium]
MLDDHPSGAASKLEGRVNAAMPQLTTELADLIRIPSVSEVGYPAHTHAPLLQARDWITAALTEAGCTVTSLDLPDTAPIILGEIEAPAGAPTVLLYSHYDVVPAGDESLWDTPAFEPEVRDGALFGRGAGDTKSNIMAIIGALRAWDGRPPVGVRVVIEGQEEVGGGALTTYPPTNPALFAADAMVIADMGSLRPGLPTLTTSLRGMCNVIIEARTIASAKHSGSYGGAAPDALLAVVRALSTLHDDSGDVAVEGLLRDEWTAGGPDEAEFAELAEVVDGQPLIGTRTLGSRVWTGPSITVIGMDTPPVDGALNAVQPYARAIINVRVHPKQDAGEAQAAVIRHLSQVNPFGITLTVTPGPTGNGFAADTTSAAYAAAESAWTAAWGTPTVAAGAGGSIPLVSALAQAAPEAVIVLGGATDGFANIHGPNERVMLDEFEKTTVAIADFLGRMAPASDGSAS